MKLFLRFEQALFNYIKKLLFFVLVLLFAIVTLNVFFRYFLKSTLFWAVEISTFAFVWTALIGAAVGLHLKEHPSIDLVVNLCPRHLRNAIIWIADFIVITFLAVTLVLSIKLTISMGDRPSESLRISYSWLYAALPTSMVCMLVAQIAQMCKRVLDGGEAKL